MISSSLILREEGEDKIDHKNVLKKLCTNVNMLMKMQLENVDPSNDTERPRSLALLKSSLSNIMNAGVQNRRFGGCDLILYDESKEDVMIVEMGPKEVHVVRSLKSGLLQAVCSNDLLRFRRLRNSRVNFDYTTFIDHTQKTLLHVACEKGCLKIVKDLVEDCKVPINIRYYDYSNCVHGMTPLHAALMYDHLNVANYLIKKRKARTDLDYRGVTASQMIRLGRLMRNKKRLDKLTLDQLKDILRRIRGRFMLRSRVLNYLLKRIGTLTFLKKLQKIEKVKMRKLAKLKMRSVNKKSLSPDSKKKKKPEDIPVEIFCDKHVIPVVKTPPPPPSTDEEGSNLLEEENMRLREALAAALSPRGMNSMKIENPHEEEEEEDVKKNVSVDVQMTMVSKKDRGTQSDQQQQKKKGEIEDLMSLRKRSEEERVKRYVSLRKKLWERKLKAAMLSSSSSNNDEKKQIEHLTKLTKEVDKEVLTNEAWAREAGQGRALFRGREYHDVKERIRDLVSLVRERENSERIGFGDMMPLRHSTLGEHEEGQPEENRMMITNYMLESMVGKDCGVEDLGDFEIL